MVRELEQFFCLWTKLQEVQLNDVPDSTTSGQYSAASAYDIQFLVRVENDNLNVIWSFKTEGKIKFFLWLLLQNRLWTADRLCKRGWPHDDKGSE